MGCLFYLQFQILQPTPLRPPTWLNLTQRLIDGATNGKQGGDVDDDFSGPAEIEARSLRAGLGMCPTSSDTASPMGPTQIPVLGKGGPQRRRRNNLEMNEVSVRYWAGRRPTRRTRDDTSMKCNIKCRQDSPIA